MNPEFRRNLWLELTPRRVVFMVAILALIFFAVAVTSDKTSAMFGTIPGTAEFLFWVIAVLWGARNAGLSVVGEIRDRTWDLQRLSSVGAGEMTWGKLFGSTIYNWLGGVICLAVMLAYGIAHGAVVTALIDTVYYVTVALIAQSTALLASLIGVRRRTAHSRLDVFIYQLAGIVASLGVLYVWEAADPEGSYITGFKATKFIAWWGMTLDARPFLLGSLAIFAAWIFVACNREMRRELKMTNGPLVWLGFLVFIGLYVAGFDTWLTPDDAHKAVWTGVALRLGLATLAFGVLTYIMVLLEPKDRVLYRWYGSQIAAGRVGLMLARLQAWIMSYVATAIVAVALIWWLTAHGSGADLPAVTAAGLGFLTRDAAIFVLMATTRRRGDFAAVIVLLALYILIPAILDGIGFSSALPFFYPKPSTPMWLGPVAAWGEAIAAVSLAIGRLAIGEKK